MMIHTLRTITIGDFSEMITYNDLNKIKSVNIWLPRRYLDKAYHKLINEWNKSNNGEKLEKEIQNNSHKLKLLTQINIQYPIMLKMLDLSAKYSNIKAKELLTDMYKKIYNKEPKTTKDYIKISKDIDLKIRKYKQRYGQEEEKDEGLDFEKMIIQLELIMAPITIRDKKMYTLPNYIGTAAKKVKQNG